MKQISILGCGWLGLPLAEVLLSKEFVIKGSTTSEQKRSILENARVKPFVIDLGTDAIQGDVYSFLEGSEILIIDIPPKLRKENSESFVDKIKFYLSLKEKEDELFVISNLNYMKFHEKFHVNTMVDNFYKLYEGIIHA